MRMNLTCEVMAPCRGALYLPAHARSASSIRGPAPPGADQATHYAVGPRTCRRQLDAASLVPRDRTISAEPRHDLAPLRALGDSAARPEYVTARRGFCAGLRGTFARGAGFGARGDRANLEGAQTLSGLRARPTFRRDAVRARLGDAVPGRRGHGRHRQDDGRGGGRGAFRRRPPAKSRLTVAWMLSNPSLALDLTCKAASSVQVRSQADIEARSNNVSFTPESGHWLSVSGCPLCAKSGSRCNQISGIDSSAQRGCRR